ncbi:MAG: PQQ-binding-like beta-propeller repeat protein [Bacteroidota bacterium]
MRQPSKGLLFYVVAWFTVHWTTAQVQPTWSTELPGVGVYSSPRLLDVNQDGWKDIILGVGKREFQYADTAVVALDGRNGQMLWHVSARDQIFGSACLLDITGDGTEDVVIGGRSAELKAIDGRSGELIWEFTGESDTTVLRDLGYFNFYNAQIIPDQDGDRQADLLVANGGDVNAAPGDPNRPVGHLFMISGQSGALIAKAAMPDGKETYMSAVVVKLNPKDKDHTVIFGTGGETVGGSLYRTSLKSIRRGNLQKAERLATSTEEKGFIAPPVLLDLNDDGTLDIVANAVEGTTYAFNGRSGDCLWVKGFDNTEAYSSLAPGYFRSPDRLDLFTIYAKGVWPELNDSKQYLLNGDDGSVLYTDSIGFVQTCSPVAADLDRDGLDEILLSVNVKVETPPFVDYYNILALFDFQSNQFVQVTEATPGLNLASTPWIGDLDGDGSFDIIYCSLSETKDMYAMKGMRINLIKTSDEIPKPVQWGAYMGSNYRGVLER